MNSGIIGYVAYNVCAVILPVFLLLKVAKSIRGHRDHLKRFENREKDAVIDSLKKEVDKYVKTQRTKGEMVLDARGKTSIWDVAGIESFVKGGIVGGDKIDLRGALELVKGHCKKYDFNCTGCSMRSGIDRQCLLATVPERWNIDKIAKIVEGLDG